MINIMNTAKKTNTFLSYYVLFLLAFLLIEVGLGQNKTTEIKVGVVLDLQTTFSQICLTSINMSLSDFYEHHPTYRTRLKLHIRDSMEDTVEASAAALDLVKNEQVSAIIGPTYSTQAEFMIRIANKTQVPIITFSATSPLLKSIRSPYFVRATLDDSTSVQAIVAIVKFFGWRSIVAIYVDNEFGEGILPYLSDELQDVKIERSVILLKANDDQILMELYRLMTMPTRVYVVHMTTSLAFRVFEKAKEIGMMDEGYVWLMTNAMTHMMKHINNGSSFKTIEGALGVRSHVPKSKELQDFKSRWRKTFRKATPGIFALWAYDSITALAMAVEETSLRNLRYDNTSASSSNMTDLGTLGLSRYGPSLLKALSDVTFKGLAGDFDLIDGQLESPKFEIINFDEKEEKVIGSWSNKTISFAGERFGDVIWPGKSKNFPKGWEIAPKGRKIKVGIPKKRGFLNFVEVKYDLITNVTSPTGYAIDIFEAALKKLPYSIVPQYIPFESLDDEYNHLVSQLHNEQNWDAVVGDVTITADRSIHADFTLPYTESGVSMMVPVRDSENKNAWVFLKPWSLDLWVTTGCFFVFIGFVVWLFEHRINTDFRGPPRHQIGTSFCFSFSTMVFAHREKVVSNLARFVVVVWCFVVLVLTQSYTANLTSFLTVRRFQPTTITLEDLKNKGDFVGYQYGSFVKDTLIELGFKEFQLKYYNSAEECDELFSNGSIRAAFDEVAYLRAILSRYCSKYSMVEPTFKTAGFGFAFPKNSPLTGDISRAILNLTKDHELESIEKKWFKNPSDCPDPKTTLSSNRLSLSSFWGLFLIAGIASFLAILVFVASFLYEQRHTLCHNSEDSLWRKLMFLCRIFDEKDINSHTFRNSAVQSPMTQCTPSPSTIQIIPWTQNSSPNREFELRRMSFNPNEESITTQPIHDQDEESDIEYGANH